jgi:hypothetical protein
MSISRLLGFVTPNHLISTNPEVYIVFLMDVVFGSLEAFPISPCEAYKPFGK